MTEPASDLARTAQILRFLLKYRSAGVFTGLDLDATTLDPADAPDTEGKPEEFVTDLGGARSDLSALFGDRKARPHEERGPR